MENLQGGLHRSLGPEHLLRQSNHNIKKNLLNSTEQKYSAFRHKRYSCGFTHAAFLDPIGHLFISDVLAAGEFEELVCFFLLPLDAAAALLIQLFVALPQLQKGFAASQTLRNLLQ